MNAILAPDPTGSATDHLFRDRLPGDDLRGLVTSPSVVLDCGAGAGGFARNAREIWPNATVISFEPATRFNQSLQPIDGSHFVKRIALGNENGAAQLKLTHGPESNSILEFMPDGPLSRIHAVVGSETVEMRRLDDIISPENRAKVGVLKLDVQGYELEVLKGAEELLQHKPVIYCEVSLQPLYQDQPLLADVDAYLAERGYRRLYLYASPMPDLWADAVYVPAEHSVDDMRGSAATRSEGGSIRLNIGAGDTVIPGFTPIDRKFGTEAYPLNYADGSVDEIRCVHMLEHLSYREVPEALREWHRVLKPGGLLRISVPDVVKVLSLRGKDQHWAYYMMGGQLDQNDFHKSCYDEERLDAYMTGTGFTGVKKWASRNTDLAASDISLNLECRKPGEAIPASEQLLKIRAVIGMPRIGWNDGWQTIVDAMAPFKIPIETHQGCFWGQNIQKAFNRAVRDGIDWIVTLDYDSMIQPAHVARLLEILGTHPEIDAIAALQMRRGGETPLFSTGKTNAQIDWSPLKVNTAHFGLTILRVECLKDIPKPWLIDVPDANGDFDGEHTDADITFWKKWTAAGHSVYVAPDVRIGHLELLVSEFDEELKPRHYQIGKWWNLHAKAGHCMRTKKED